MSFYELPPQAVQAWNDRAREVWQQWKNEMNNRSLPGTKILREWERLVGGSGK